MNVGPSTTLKHLGIALGLLFCFATAGARAAGGYTSPTAYVDPFIGTGGAGWGVGSIVPGATRPFGMVKLSPDTSTGDYAPDFAHCGGYWYPDTEIRGFTHNHLVGTGAADQGNILVMPIVGINDYLSTEEGYRSRFDHETEVASPGYYAVTLDDDGIRAELTATEHVGFHRYTFPPTAQATVLIDVSAVMRTDSATDESVQVLPGNAEIVGSMTNHGSLSKRYGGQTIYFSAQFKRPMDDWGTFADGVVSPGATTAAGEHIGAYAQFDVRDGSPVELAVGISYISVEQAQINRMAEALGTWSFDRVREEAEAAWDAALSVIEVEGGTERQRRIFYTALYHAMMMPTLYTDVNGLYMGFDGSVHSADGFRYYTDMSLWDTFRTLHPLLTLIAPDIQADIITSMVKMYEQSGYIDRWPQGNGATGSMIGDSPAIVIADAWLKGVRDFDIDTAYEALVRQGTLEDPDAWHRPDLETYLTRQFLAMEDTGGSVSKTLEYAYADAALSLLAQALGDDTRADQFRERAGYYRNHYNPATGFLQGRHADGSFLEPFSPYYSADQYVEGNAYHWTWYVPYDVAGLIQLFGGDQVMGARLDELFRRSEFHHDTALPDLEYWHGNEPDLHVSYLYDFAGRPDKTQHRVRWVMETKYDDTPAGLDGNDDGGTLSAWYVFSAMGIYPVAGTDVYLIGSPLFSRTTLHLKDGDVVITARDASQANAYIQSAELDGRPLDHAWLTHADLIPGRTLDMVMGPKASAWARDGAKPPSLSTSK